MGKPTICIGENKDADQADHRLCFRYSDSTIPLLLKSKISSFLLFSVLVQTGLCQTYSETTLLVFPRGGSYLSSHIGTPSSLLETLAANSFLPRQSLFLIFAYLYLFSQHLFYSHKSMINDSFHNMCNVIEIE